MYFHKQELQYNATPAKPDAVYARKMQEILGGQYGEITVAMQYGFQAFNAHIPGKYRDLLYGIGAEEIGHVEMIATMIAQLLEKAPQGISDDAIQDDPAVAAVVGGMDVQHAIVAGAGARPVDSNGNPWQGSYITASGNLLADFVANANAEMQGRLQVARILHQTDDAGVRDMLGFLTARDTAHQNQWIAAAQELREEGYEDIPVPNKLPREKEFEPVEYQFINFSDGAQAGEGAWANGPTPDGRGTFSYVETPDAGVPMPPPTIPDPRYFGTTPLPNAAEVKQAAKKDRKHQE
ncbi:manganese catalase [Subtercola sp. Z020]|uniref:manganese catalase family protein n=1 Tax=Subtercola sp. Z020 TaxID=2080582 RepID=UPI000CE9020C|nr:manganese catalase family protein [Subtercola sp. Z020]PPF81305.1 manganese catalase [Subtercola sp. Z020]